MSIPIGNHRLRVPLSHDLPVILRSFPFYSTNLGRIARAVTEKYGQLTFIDVGANIGDSVAFVRNEVMVPVLCIEGDPYFFGILKQNMSGLPQVHLEHAFVGAETKIVHETPQRHGGSTALVPSGHGMRIHSLPDILAKHPTFHHSKLLKIDTDGYDGWIIRGASVYLSDAKPILFFEYDPFFLYKADDDGISIFPGLRELGYRKMMVYNNYGEYMLSVDMDHNSLIEEIHCHVLGHHGHRYYDICAFHSDDIDLFERLRRREVDYFHTMKTGSSVS